MLPAGSAPAGSPLGAARRPRAVNGWYSGLPPGALLNRTISLIPADLQWTPGKSGLGDAAGPAPPASIETSDHPSLRKGGLELLSFERGHQLLEFRDRIRDFRPHVGDEGYAGRPHHDSGRDFGQGVVEAHVQRELFGSQPSVGLGLSGLSGGDICRKAGPWRWRRNLRLVVYRRCLGLSGGRRWQGSLSPGSAMIRQTTFGFLLLHLTLPSFESDRESADARRRCSPPASDWARQPRLLATSGGMGTPACFHHPGPGRFGGRSTLKDHVLLPDDWGLNRNREVHRSAGQPG